MAGGAADTLSFFLFSFSCSFSFSLFFCTLWEEWIIKCRTSESGRRRIAEKNGAHGLCGSQRTKGCVGPQADVSGVMKMVRASTALAQGSRRREAGARGSFARKRDIGCVRCEVEKAASPWPLAPGSWHLAPGTEKFTKPMALICHGDACDCAASAEA